MLTYLGTGGSPLRNVSRDFPADSAATNEISREFVPKPKKNAVDIAMNLPGNQCMILSELMSLVLMPFTY